MCKRITQTFTNHTMKMFQRFSETDVTQRFTVNFTAMKQSPVMFVDARVLAEECICICAYQVVQFMFCKQCRDCRFRVAFKIPQRVIEIEENMFVNFLSP